MTDLDRLDVPQTEAIWKEMLLDACASDGPIRDNDVRQAIDRYRPRIEGVVAAWAGSASLNVDEWADVMMDALRNSDDGNNPFYSDDEDTISLARQLGEAVVARLAYSPLDPSDD